MSSGLATQRTTSVLRGKQRHQYPGSLRAGELACGRGAWVVAIAKDGTPSEPAWEASRRLYANLGDLLLVCGGDVAAMRITEVIEPGGNERWRVERVCGACGDGRVLVMSLCGLTRRRAARKALRRGTGINIAEQGTR